MGRIHRRAAHARQHAARWGPQEAQEAVTPHRPPPAASAAVGERQVNHHAYNVRWSAEDNEYVALVAEFPSLSWLDKDPVRALAGLVKLVDDVRKDITRPNPDSLTPTSRSRLERYAINGKLNVQGRRGRPSKAQKDCQNPE